jgi:hypothetical protein
VDRGGLHAAELDAGDKPVSITWQVAALRLLTFGEVLVSATGLEFAYSQAPPDEGRADELLEPVGDGRQPVGAAGERRGEERRRHAGAGHRGSA